MMKNKINRSTIKDIAEKSGVSISTVSNVINGKTNAMGKETLDRVKRVMDEMNYRPNSVARGLALQHTAAIGLLLAEIETPLFLQTVTPIEREARHAGYSLPFMNAQDSEDEKEAIRLLNDKEVDGLVIISTSDPRSNDHFRQMKEDGIPFVLINRFDTLPDFDQINWDNKNGVNDAVNHLSKLGHMKIALLIGPENRRSTKERIEGYLAGLQQNKLLSDTNPLIFPCDYTSNPEEWKRSLDQLLSLPQPPTAIIASDDIVAEVILKELQKRGVNVPKDISIIGIDDQPFSKYLGLTTIQLPVVEAGKIAIQFLLNRITNPDIEPQKMMLPCPLIIRDTCGEIR
jgi:LacI family transcriptional regulator